MPTVEWISFEHFNSQCWNTGARRRTRRSTYLAIFVHRLTAFQSNPCTLVPAAHPFLVPLNEWKHTIEKQTEN